MKSFFRFFLIAIVVLQSPRLTAEDRSSKAMQKFNAQLSQWKFFDVNLIRCNINSAGPYCDHLRTNSAGLFWPKDSNSTAVFTAGIWLAGFHTPSDSIRIAIQQYSTEYQPGPILSTFNTVTNNANAAGDPADSRYRIYKIEKRDARTGTNPDYTEWPGDLGAPYIDINGNGKWDKGIDTPKFWGDQQLWCVYNDANYANHQKVGLTKPMGVEIQATYFGFDATAWTQNVMFIRWKLINKSDADYDSVFFGMWSDTDLGNQNDDCAGVDVERNLEYVYNGDSLDEGGNGYGLKPPAAGFVLLQGPKVVATPNDSALFESKWVRGYKNINAYAHSYIVREYDSGPPPLGRISMANKVYSSLNGRIPRSGLPFVDPTTNLPTHFVFSGDPVTDSGWTHKKTLNPDDVQTVLSTGPFVFAKGDTQEIVGAFIIARGDNRLQSITKLRLYTDIARESFLDNFSIYQTPFVPPITKQPEEFLLYQNYPNPFNPATEIRFSLPLPSHVRIELFNTLGQSVGVLTNSDYDRGFHSLKYTSNLSTGVYICIFTAQTSGEYKIRTIATTKMVLLK